MSRVARILLHRAWLPGVLIVTAAMAVPRARAIVRNTTLAGRTVGVYGWEAVDPGANGDAQLRWTRAVAAIREPVQGTTLTLPVFVSRADIASRPVELRLTIGGARVQLVTLSRNGWHLLTYDLTTLFGAADLQQRRTVTLKVNVTPTAVPARDGSSSADTRELGVGLGAIRWSGPARATEASR